MPFEFHPELSLEENFRTIALEQLDAALSAALDVARPAPERVHAARTACKRLRGLLRSVAPGFSAYKSSNAAIRDAAASLSRLRDSDVMGDTLGRIVNKCSVHLPPEIDGTLRQRLAGQVVEPEAEGALLAQFALAIAPVRGRAERWSLSPNRWSVAADAMADTYRRARQAMHDASETGDAAGFHEWRKHAKYGLYQLELLGPFSGNAGKADIDKAKKLAKLLGRHHDLHVLREHLGEGGASLSDEAPELASAMDATTQALEKRILELGAELYDRRPKAWKRHLQSWIPSKPRRKAA